MLQPCPSCGAHVTQGTCRCPHCGDKMCADRRSTAALLLGLAVGGCQIGVMEPEYGVAVTDIDIDGDGWNHEEDCDDDDPDVHPEAEETPGDGVDQNCDGEDDT